MATQFPEELDSFTNPQPTDSVATVSHATQHSNANDAIEALQAKVGVDGSTDTTSLDYRISSLENNPQTNTEEVQDIVGGLFNAGTHTNITVTYDDLNNKISLSTELNTETVIDAIAEALTAGNGITKTYDDPAGTITLSIDTNSIATNTYVDQAISNLINSAPGVLDTLKELADAIGNDADFFTTVNNAITNAVTTANSYTDTAIGGLSTVYEPIGAEQNAKDYADSLAVNYDPVGAAATAQANAEDYADTASTTAENNAKSYADSLATNYDPAGSAATAQANAALYTDNQISNLNTDSFLEGTNKYFTSERAQDAVAAALTGATHTNISVTYDDDNNHIILSASYGQEEILDAVATAITAGTGIIKTYDDPNNTITLAVDTASIATQSYVDTAISNLIDSSPALLDTLNEIAAAINNDPNFSTTITNALATKITASSTDTLTNKTISLADNTLSGTLAEFNTALTDADFATTTDVSDALTNANTYSDTAVETHSDLTTGVHGVVGNVVGTSDTQTLTNKTMGDDLLMDGNQISGLGTPTQADHAATKAYVDSFTEGLHVHASAHAATTTNLTSFTGLTSLTIDGHVIQDQERVLVKNQSNPAENGIYVYDSTLQTLTRSLDYNQASEIDAGDFIFISNGNTYNNTGWVQENNITTLGTDAISWIQFSGAGTYLAGNGLILDGNTFTIDDSITATKTYVDTQDTATLNSANDYTDLAIAGLGDTVESGYIPIGQKATAGGVASLDLDGFVPDTQLNINERIEDVAAAMITGGTHTNITTSYNDNTGKLNLTAVPLTQEQVQDFVAPLFAHSNHVNITAVYDDNNNRVILQGNAGGGGGGATDIALIIGLS